MTGRSRDDREVQEEALGPGGGSSPRTRREALALGPGGTRETIPPGGTRKAIPPGGTPPYTHPGYTTLHIPSRAATRSARP